MTQFEGFSSSLHAVLTPRTGVCRTCGVVRVASGERQTTLRQPEGLTHLGDGEKEGGDGAPFRNDRERYHVLEQVKENRLHGESTEREDEKVLGVVVPRHVLAELRPRVLKELFDAHTRKNALVGLHEVEELERGRRALALRGVEKSQHGVLRAREGLDRLLHDVLYHLGSQLVAQQLE